MKLKEPQMYAVIRTGGKQYRVAEGDKLRVEKLVADEGADITFDQVMMLADGDQVQVGKPFLSGQQVQAQVLSHGRGKKVKIIKFRRRKHHLKRQGHRQSFTEVRITGIGGASSTASAPPAAVSAPVEAAAAA